MTPENASKIVQNEPLKLALCGLGRAGTFHINNILGNRRIILKYIIEGDLLKWEPAKKMYNIPDVKFLEPEVHYILYLEGNQY